MRRTGFMGTIGARLAGLLAILCATGLTADDSWRQTLVIARGGASPIHLFIGEAAAAPVRYAAEELQRFLREMTGVEIPIRSAPQLQNSTDLAIGETILSLDPQSLPDSSRLGREGYVLRTVERNLFIRGGSPRGLLYGVYGLLQDHLGCRWFTPEVSRIPARDRLEIPSLDEAANPPLEYREPFVKEAMDPDWAARNRVNGHFFDLDERHGGKVSYRGFVHTYEALIPPEEYYDEHPEFFALVDGLRLEHRSQLCNTNPELAKVVTERIRQLMRDHPEDSVFSVSQNDWDHFCECESCASLAEAEGTQAAPILHLVNYVARAVRAEFPDKLIDTLAYSYSRKPPKTMKPEPNVIVRLCSIECCFNHPFDECASDVNKRFVEDVIGWSRICKRLWVWDYVTSFSHYLTPFPNLHVRGPNIKFLAERNVTGMFEQDVYNTPDGELSGLSGYLNAQLLWNPDSDPQRIVEEFVSDVYGAAAPHVLAYLRALEGTAEDPDIHSEIWDGPDAPYVTDEFLAHADSLWAKAEAAVSGSPEVLARVKTARMPVDYALLEHARFDGLRALEPAEGMPWGVRIPADLVARIERFFRVAETSQLSRIREHGISVAEYKSGWSSLLAAPDQPARPSVEVPHASPGLQYGFYEGRWTELPDFEELTPAAEGIATGVTLEVSPVEMSYGLRFEGYFKAPETGLYCLTLVSNDGTRLILDGEVSIDHDVRHMAIPMGNLVPLEAGFHPIVVEYFQSAGRKHLELFVEGPGLERQIVPLHLLWRRD